MTRFLLLLGVTLLVTGRAQVSSPVGWRFEVASDPSRSYEPEAGDLAGPGPRPVAITLVYPAASSALSPSTYDELARLGAYDRFRQPPASALAAAAANALTGANPASPPLMTRDAPPSAGRYPLVLFAHSTPLGIAAMSADLAAHGFVVAGVISRGAERAGYRLSVADVQAMADDLSLALARVRSMPFVDTARIGVIGMSNGALGAVALANRTRVDAMVSLDGTIGERAAARVLPELGSASAPASTPPLLHLYAPENSYLDFSELRKRPGECVTVRVPDIGHSDFLTFALLRPVNVSEAPRRDRVVQKFSSIVRLTREFLAAKLGPGADHRAAARLDETDRALGLTSAACSAL